MELDREFKTYEELDLFPKEWEKETHQVFTTFKSKKFDKGDQAREKLAYKEIGFAYLHGKERPSQTAGGRPFQHTKKTDCPVWFQVNGYKRSSNLIVRLAPFISQHNHPLTEASWSHEFRQRRSNDAEQQTVKDLLSSGLKIY